MAEGQQANKNILLFSSKEGVASEESVQAPKSTCGT